MRPALEDGQRRWQRNEVDAAVADAALMLRDTGTRVLATLLDNTPAFVVLDEALLNGSQVHVPLPLFFTPAQMQHALQASGVDMLLTSPAQAARWPGLAWLPVTVAGEALMRARLRSAPVALPPGTAKISFTSGTTGAPKGVCLSGEAMRRVAAGLVQAMAPLDIQRHLNALPFSVLLENIAGLMAPRLHGATVVTLPLRQVGLEGSSSFDAARFHDTVQQQQPHSLILLPQMLRAWCGHLGQSGQRPPVSLKLVAVGGAAVGAPAPGLAVVGGEGDSIGADCAPDVTPQSARAVSELCLMRPAVFRRAGSHHGPRHDAEQRDRFRTDRHAQQHARRRSSRRLAGHARADRARDALRRQQGRVPRHAASRHRPSGGRQPARVVRLLRAT